MATNTYAVLMLNVNGSQFVDVVADGFRVKDDGWIHFYVDGEDPGGPKETVKSFSPKAGVLSIEKRVDEPPGSIGQRIIARLEKVHTLTAGAIQHAAHSHMKTQAIRIVREECGVAE